MPLENFSSLVNEFVDHNTPIAVYILMYIWNDMITSYNSKNFNYNLEIIGQFSNYFIILSALIKRCIDPMSSFLKYNPRENDNFTE